MLWQKKHWAVVIGSSRNSIDLEVDSEDMGKWRLTGMGVQKDNVGARRRAC